MSLNFPHTQAVYARDQELRVRRLFPLDTDVKVREGKRVFSDTLLAQVEPRTVAVRVDIPAALGLPPAETAKHLTLPLGSTVTAGQVVAKTRRGIRTATVSSPIAGTLLEVDAETGEVLIAPEGAGQFTALISGDVIEVLGRSELTIRTVGSRVSGIVGIGQPVIGPLRVLTPAADTALSSQSLPADLAGAIVVAGGIVTAAAYRALAAAGVAALVTGSISPREIGAAFDWDDGDHLSSWRPLAGDRRFAPRAKTPFAVMATEGFGTRGMSPELFAVLGGWAGTTVTLFPTTGVTGALMRPELIRTDDSDIDTDALPDEATLTPGAVVRLTDQVRLGQRATVVDRPYRHRFPNGVMTDAIDVDLGTGDRTPVRVVNVEVLLVAPHRDPEFSHDPA
ncbi:MAG: hypothetical protein WKF80_09810 [Thermomicrobiales bacterium]